MDSRHGRHPHKALQRLALSLIGGLLWGTGLSVQAGVLYPAVRVDDSGAADTSIGVSSTTRNVAVASDGTIYVAYSSSSGGIRVARSSNRGQSFLPSIQVTPVVSAPELAVSSSGAVFVAWAAGGTAWVSRSLDQGQTFSAAVNAGPASSSVHMATNGNRVYLVDKPANRLLASSDAGTTFSALNTGIGGQAYADVQVDANGVVIIQADNPLVKYTTSTNHGASLSAQTLPVPGGNIYYSVAALSNSASGRYLIVAGYSTDGLRINLDNNSSQMLNTFGNSDAEGRFLAANSCALVDGYLSGGSARFHVSRDHGTSFGTATVVATATSANAAINPATEDVVVTYQSGGRIYLSSYSGELPDCLPPTLSSVGVADTAGAGTLLEATSNETGNGFWVLLGGPAAPVPTAAQVRAGQASNGASALASGSGAMVGGIAKRFSVTGLAASSTYTLCAMAEDSAGNRSNVACTDVTTTPSNLPSSSSTSPVTMLPSGGGELGTFAGNTVLVSDNSRAGSTLTLTGAGRTRIVLDNGAALLLETEGTTRFTVVRTNDGQLALHVDEGSFTVGGGNHALLFAGGGAVSGLGNNNNVRAIYAGGKLIKLSVLSGTVLLPGNTFAALDNTLYAGEVADFDNNQRVSARYLGSLHGNGGQLGDRLPPASSVLTVAGGIPRLSALPERQRAQGLSTRLDRQLTAALQSLGLQAQEQDGEGVIRLTGPGGELYAALPLGRVQIAEGEASGVTFNADGSLRVVLNGYAVQLVPSVVSPGALANEMAARQPGSTASIGGEGEWRFSGPAGQSTVVRPGWALTPAANGAGLQADATGILFFAHDRLFGSVLHPALAERSRLLAAARQLDASATLTSVAGGETVLLLHGKRYVLTPEQELTDIPAAHAGDAFWLEGSKLVVPTGNGKAQGFTVR